MRGTFTPDGIYHGTNKCSNFPRRSGQGVYLQYATSWFKLIAANYVRHEISMQKLLECDLFSLIVTAINN